MDIGVGVELKAPLRGQSSLGSFGGFALHVDQMPKASLSGASYLDLFMTTRSLEAIALVDAVATALADYELRRKGKATRRGESRKGVIHLAVAAIIGSILRAWASDPPLPVYRALKAEGFSGIGIGYRVFAATIHAVHELGYVYWRGGFKRKGELGTGRASRFWPTHRLLRLAANHGVDRDTVRDDFGRLMRPGSRRPRKIKDPIVLKALRLHTKARPGARLPIDPHDPMAMVLAADVVEQNALAASTLVEGCPQPVWRREFKADLFANLYGRWHEVGDGNYQSLSAPVRLLIRINHEPVMEIDISASLLSIMHGVVGRPMASGDPYVVPGIPRPVVKTWVNATLGKGSAVIKWPKASMERIEGLRMLRPADVGGAITRLYPFLAEPWKAAAHLADFGPPKRVLHHLLTGIESRIITHVMRELREQGVLALPMHDGIIVPASAAATAQNLLLDAGRRIGKVDLRLTVDGPAVRAAENSKAVA